MPRNSLKNRVDATLVVYVVFVELFHGWDELQEHSVVDADGNCCRDSFKFGYSEICEMRDNLKFVIQNKY